MTGQLKVTSDLRGATSADVFFICQENESSSVKVSFPKNNVSKLLKRARVFEKKRFFKIKLNKLPRCHNPVSH